MSWFFVSDYRSLKEIDILSVWQRRSNWPSYLLSRWTDHWWWQKGVAGSIRPSDVFLSDAPVAKVVTKYIRLQSLVRTQFLIQYMAGIIEWGFIAWTSLTVCCLGDTLGNFQYYFYIHQQANSFSSSTITKGPSYEIIVSFISNQPWMTDESRMAWTGLYIIQYLKSSQSFAAIVWIQE